jgi:alanyl-tRNA synthetase
LYQAVDNIIKYFKEEEKSDGYFAILDVEGNAKVLTVPLHCRIRVLRAMRLQILSNVITQGKKLGKAVYVFSTDHEGDKVAHGNHVPQASKAKGLDARTWALKVSEVLGGKAGGKDDGAQGVGTNVGNIEEAMKVAKDYYLTTTQR